MKKISPAFSLEKVLFLQRGICTLLVALMLIFSFGPLFAVPFTDEFEEFYDYAESDENAESEQNTVFLKVDFSTSVLAVFKFITLSAAKSSELSDIYYIIIESKDASDISTRAAGLAFMFMEACENDFTVVIYLALLIALCIAVPIVILVSLIFMFIKYGTFSKGKDEHLRYKGAMRHLRHVVYLMPMCVLPIAVAPKIHFGFSAIALIALGCLALLTNAAAPYLKNYTKAQRKYARMLQCVSLFGIGVFVTFCISLIRSHAMSKFVGLFNHQSLFEFVSLFEGGNFNLGKYISVIVGLAVLLGLYSTFNSPALNLCRFGIITTRMKAKDYTRGDSHITKTLLPNIILLMYFLVLGSHSEFVLYEGEIVYFIVCMASFTVMTLTEAIVILLGTTLCIDLGSAGKDTVLEGTVYEAQVEGYEPSRVSLKTVFKEEKPKGS